MNMTIGIVVVASLAARTMRSEVVTSTSGSCGDYVGEQSRNLVPLALRRSASITSGLAVDPAAVAEGVDEGPRAEVHGV